MNHHHGKHQHGHGRHHHRHGNGSGNHLHKFFEGLEISLRHGPASEQFGGHHRHHGQHGHKHLGRFGKHGGPGHKHSHMARHGGPGHKHHGPPFEGPGGHFGKHGKHGFLFEKSGRRHGKGPKHHHKERPHFGNFFEGRPSWLDFCKTFGLSEVEMRGRRAGPWCSCERNEPQPNVEGQHERQIPTQTIVGHMSSHRRRPPCCKIVNAEDQGEVQDKDHIPSQTSENMRRFGGKWKRRPCCCRKTDAENQPSSSQTANVEEQNEGQCKDDIPPEWFDRMRHFRGRWKRRHCCCCQKTDDAEQSNDKGSAPSQDTATAPPQDKQDNQGNEETVMEVTNAVEGTSGPAKEQATTDQAKQI